MKFVCSIVLVFSVFNVSGMKYNGIGGGYFIVAPKYEEKLNTLSKHESLWLISRSDVFTIRGDAASFIAWGILCEAVKKVASLANIENVNHRDAQGRTILHWVAEYGTNSDLEFLKDINGLCPLQMSNKGLLPCMLVPENKRDMKQLLDTLGRSHNSCPLCL